MSRCVSCCPVLLKPYIFCVHVVQFDAQKRALQVTDQQLQLPFYNFFKKVRTDHIKIGNYISNSYARGVERPFLDFARITSSPVAEILLVYAFIGVEVRFTATQRESV
ncbi:hypothetical protein Trydic_g19671 [Trypoxylus dichotomus]